MKYLRMFLMSFMVVVFLHLTDLNPIWRWEWYRQTVGGWIVNHPKITIILFTAAVVLVMRLREYKLRPPRCFKNFEELDEAMNGGHQLTATEMRWFIENEMKKVSQQQELAHLKATRETAQTK